MVVYSIISIIHPYNDIYRMSDLPCSRSVEPEPTANSFSCLVNENALAGVKTEMGQYWFLRTSAPWEVLVRNQSALVRIFTIP